MCDTRPSPRHTYEDPSCGSRTSRRRGGCCTVCGTMRAMRRILRGVSPCSPSCSRGRRCGARRAGPNVNHRPSLTTAPVDPLRPGRFDVLLRSWASAFGRAGQVERLPPLLHLPLCPPSLLLLLLPVTHHHSNHLHNLVLPVATELHRQVWRWRNRALGGPVYLCPQRGGTASALRGPRGAREPTLPLPTPVLLSRPPRSLRRWSWRAPA